MTPNGWSALRRRELAGLWAEVHRRLATGRPVSAVTVALSSEGERDAVADLLGLVRRPGATHRVPLAALDEVTRACVGVDTRGAVTELVGPVGDASADRTAARRARAALWTWLREHRVVVAQPALLPWVEGLRVVDSSVPATRTLLTSALRILGALPAEGVPLPVLAETHTGDPHALDEGTRLSTTVLRALAALSDVEVPTTAGGRHALWERAGVAHDRLSVTVLAAGLRPTDDSVAAAVLRSCADGGHAASLTLAQLRASPALTVTDDVVRAVENPSILALAVDRFGAACPPLVCTAGWPNGAAAALLRLLPPGVRYHGDLDGEGLRIAAHLVSSCGVVPWRLTTTDYLDAVRTNGPPAGRVTAVPWDADLAPSLRQHGVAVTEEQVAPTLLADLAP